MRSVRGPAAVLWVGLAGAAAAQEGAVSYGLNGSPGLLDMPNAQSDAEGSLAVTLGYSDGFGRLTLAFQPTDRLTTSMRFSVIDQFDATATEVERDTFIRNFDLRYRLNDETALLPAIAIGLQDILSPGALGGEYVVATKTFGDNLAVTAGIGWGALGTRDGFDNPLGALDENLETRPTADDLPGRLNADQWFHGDAAFFAGVDYRINDRWGIKAEYSGADYPETPYGPAIDVDSPVNIGVTYRPMARAELGLAYLYGNSLALTGSVSLNANDRPGKSGVEPAPPPINARAPGDRSWDRQAAPPRALESALATLLKNEGITLTKLEITGTTARLRYINTRYRSQAQAMGRAARMMTVVLPPAIDRFVMEPEARGIPLSSTTLVRSDLEQLENRPGAAAGMWQRADFGDAAPQVTDRTDPAFTWGLGPYFALVPGEETELDLGLSLRGIYTIRPNLVLSGSIGQSLTRGDGSDPEADATPDIQNVRTDATYYGDDGVPVLQTLTLTHYARPGRDLYSRVTAGYLERMFGGVSTELLWKPVSSNLGLGLEVNYAAQRNTDMMFGFDEYDYDVVTGHVSAYYDLGNGYHTQLDLGKYLAGDWGATLSLDREYDNGIRVGAYVTRTDMDMDDYGDGAYAKGVRVTIPQDFLTGTATQRSYGGTLRTEVGDGGARLAVDGRLYDLVREGHGADLADTWGRFWR